MDDDVISPRTTFDLVGHQAAEQAFLEAWSSGRVPHAWLIVGQKGIGKATLAYRIARFVLAQDADGGGGLFASAPPTTLALSADHPVAHRVASGGHADLKVIERGWSDESKTKLKTEISVEDVRGVGAFLSLTPAEGGWRVVIVDAADEMSRSAANAILKVLEEPPRNSLLLLIAHNPGRLLPTIRSRCRRLTLRPLADDVIRGLLRRLDPDLSDEDVGIATLMAEGSIGRAHDLCDLGGLTLYRDMMALLGRLPRLDVKPLHAFADKAAANESAFRSVRDILLWWLGRSVTASAKGEEGQDDGPVPVTPPIRSVGLDRWIEVWDKIAYSFGRAEAVNLDRKLVVLNAFLALEKVCRP